MNLNELLLKLPSNWNEFTLSQFTKTLDIHISEGSSIFNGVDNTIKLLSVLLDISVEELDSLPFQDINRLASRIDFISELLVIQKKSSIKFIDINTVTHNDFVISLLLFEQLLKNLSQIIQAYRNNNSQMKKLKTYAFP